MKHYFGDKIMENKAGACGTYERGEICTRFRWGDQGERDNLKDVDVDGMILKLT